MRRKDGPQFFMEGMESRKREAEKLRQGGKRRQARKKRGGDSEKEPPLGAAAVSARPGEGGMDLLLQWRGLS
jgi:hypothetical protein